MPSDLLSAWRQRADWLREYGDPNSARLWETAARELEAALLAHGEETLSLVNAAKVSGYTADHLGQLVKRGTIRNVGREGAPRIRRADVPIKNVGGPGRPSRDKSPTVDAEREQLQRVAQSFSKTRSRSSPKK